MRRSAGGGRAGGMWAPHLCGRNSADTRTSARECDDPTRATTSRSSDKEFLIPPRAMYGMRIVFSFCGPDIRATDRCCQDADGSEKPSSAWKRPHACRRTNSSWCDGSRGWCMPSSPASATSGTQRAPISPGAWSRLSAPDRGPPRSAWPQAAPAG
jgi:hypothetical protein